MYEYKAKVLKVIDGDTVDVDIDLGFGIVLTDERVRIMGIDTPESRTSDKVEKVFGLAAKEKLKSLNSIIHPEVAKDFDSFCLNNKDEKYIVKEAAIIFETKTER